MPPASTGTRHAGSEQGPGRRGGRGDDRRRWGAPARPSPSRQVADHETSEDADEQRDSGVLVQRTSSSIFGPAGPDVRSRTGTPPRASCRWAAGRAIVEPANQSAGGTEERHGGRVLEAARGGARLRGSPRVRGDAQHPPALPRHDHLRVHAGGLLDREVRETRVTLAPAAAGRVRVRLAARGRSCELAARRARGASAHVRAGAALRSISTSRKPAAVSLRRSGRAPGARTATRWSDACVGLSGTVSMRVGGRADRGDGSEIEVPDGWAPEVPVRGTADARGRGRSGRGSATRSGAAGRS